MSSSKYVEWMRNVSDDKYLNEMTIPGTHNACAYNCNFFAKNQRLPLNSQLVNGVRFFDIRCRQVNDEFKLHHGQSFLGLNFKTDVIEVFIKFLSDHPSECVIVLVSSEYRPRNNKMHFYDVFINYANDNRDYWYLDDDLPKLKEVRGKIVLLRRFYSPKTPLGIDMSGWKDSQTFHLQNNSNFMFIIQDEYKSSITHKWNRFHALIEQTQQQIESLNFDTSETGAVDSIQSSEDDSINIVNYKCRKWYMQTNTGTPKTNIAWHVNKSLTHYLNKNRENIKAHMGIIILDFAHSNIVETICELNLKGNFNKKADVDINDIITDFDEQN